MLRGTIEVAENVFGWPVWVKEKLAAAHDSQYHTLKGVTAQPMVRPGQKELRPGIRSLVRRFRSDAQPQQSRHHGQPRGHR
jgi:hypothetical protein